MKELQTHIDLGLREHAKLKYEMREKKQYHNKEKFD